MQALKIGAIKSVGFPDGWTESSAATAVKVGLAWERVFVHGERSGEEIVFKYRGVPIDEASRKVLNFLLGQLTDASDIVLDREQLLALHTVMGVATIGDNQFTNENAPGSLEGPRFDLDRAVIQSVGGKAVLRVQGRFVNGAEYDGIFYLAGADGRVVEELFYQSTRKVGSADGESPFQAVLDSIVW